MASHAFITSWLLAPGGSGGVDWGAGIQLGAEKGIFEGNVYSASKDVWVVGVSDHSIRWESNFDEYERLGGGHGAENYTGPDVFVFWKNAAGQVIGGFLDHWNGPSTGRRRSFQNIEQFWKCRNGKPMIPKAIYRTGMYIKIGLQGDKGNIISDWFKYR